MKAQFDLSALGWELGATDGFYRGLVFATEDRNNIYGCCKMAWLHKPKSYDAMKVRSRQPPLPLPARADFSGECQTRSHGKILFREEGGVKTARASLHGVAGKQLKLVWVPRRPQRIRFARTGNPGYSCDEPRFANFVKK